MVLAHSNFASVSVIRSGRIGNIFSLMRLLRGPFLCAVASRLAARVNAGCFFLTAAQPHPISRIGTLPPNGKLFYLEG